MNVIRLWARITKKSSDVAAMKNSLAEKNTKEAFRAAHTLKGVAQNLGFTPLYETAAAITEVLRTGNLPDGESMMNAVTKEYERTIAAIVQLDA